MPFGEVKLIPGTNVERTPTLLEAGYSQTQFIRYRDGLAQKIGGWQKFYPTAVTGIPRDLHAWEDLNTTNHLAVGTTTRLLIITSGVLVDITPLTFLTNGTPNFSTVINTPTVTVIDSSIADVTTLDSVFFKTPVSVGGLILSGVYAIASIVGTNTYTITAASNATSTVNNAGSVPQFVTIISQGIVTVNFTAHGLSVNSTIIFPIATTGGGITILGLYNVNSVVNANSFTIQSTVNATSSATFSMNSGSSELLYYINLGAKAATDFQSGTPISATDYTTDNWGQILIACPQNGGIYAYDPTAGFLNAQFVRTAPPFNGGAFVSNAQQILICWGSTTTYSAGVQQDPLLVRWSASGDYTNFVVSSITQAGSYRLSNGSLIRGGMSVANKNLIWTDLDLWDMTYIGPPFVYGFNKIGAGAGLISSHAAQALRGGVFWMGQTNFYQFSSEGVKVIPCPVWDAVFQNLDTANSYKVRAMPNTPFNEVGWLYPSTSGGSGECDSYVKMNITEPGNPWDYGSISRSAWIDQTVLGMPISASPARIIYQQETTNNDDGSALTASFTTGYFMIAEGEDFAFVDQVIPDFKYGTYGATPGASIQIYFNVINYPGDTPIVYGPFTFTSTTQYVSPRFRGRQMSVTIQSSDLNSFWRIGRIRYRWASAGRR